MWFIYFFYVIGKKLLVYDKMAVFLRWKIAIMNDILKICLALLFCSGLAQAHGDEHHTEGKSENKAGEPMYNQLAPDFERLDQDGKTHRLQDYKGRWLVLYFYPRDNTPGCTTEANAFKEQFSHLQQMKTAVLGVSMNDAESHKKFIAEHKLPFNLLVDADRAMSKDYGVAGGMGLLSYSKRQTFVIGPNGNVIKHFEKVNPATHVDEVIAVLSRAQKQYRDKKHKDATPKVTEMVGGKAIYGKPWPDTEQPEYALKTLFEKPDSFLEGKMIVSGKISSVCQKMGCWMILTDGENFARVDFDNHSYFVPKESAGEAKLYGRWVKKVLTDEEIAHYESEGAKNLKKVSYELFADSVMLDH